MTKGQYSSSSGNRTYAYAELAVSSLAVAETIARTHRAYPRWDGQAELARLITYEGGCPSRYYPGSI